MKPMPACGTTGRMCFLANVLWFKGKAAESQSLGSCNFLAALCVSNARKLIMLKQHVLYSRELYVDQTCTI